MTWQHAISTIAERQAQILIDDRFRDDPLMMDSPHLAWFAIYCKLDPGSAFWNPDETAVLDGLESALLKLCQQFGNGWAIYVCRLATYGIREYFIYYGHGAQSEMVLPGLREAHPSYRLEFDVTADPKWTRYFSLMSALDAT